MYASFEFKGLIQKSGITMYMYGTHNISAGGKLYALHSNIINLDHYIGEEVVVQGLRVAGYPVDDGPELIDVKAIEKIGH